MELEEVTALARERLGLELQAVTLLRRPGPGRGPPGVWSLMTEHGAFWLVEQDGQVELFRATHTDRNPSPEATRRFRELHPEKSPVATVPPTADAPLTPAQAPARRVFDCRVCGRSVTPRRVSDHVTRQLCPPCAHATRARERYRDDPEYRAHRAAYSETLYRLRRPAGDGS